jgi:arylsulfatase A-like enzyme
VRGTRRQFIIGGAAAGAAAYVALRGTAGTAPSEKPNILMIVVDTLRADHAYGSLAATPAIDSLVAKGLSFTRVFPEAMPTVPARNSIFTGKRMFPFLDWEDRRGLIAKPGWIPVEDVDSAFTTVLRRNGYWTAYVTDNPFLGFSYPYEPLRRSFDVFKRRGGQLGGDPRGVPPATLRHWLHPANADEKTAKRVSSYIGAADYWKDESQSFAARVFSEAIPVLDQAAAQSRPFALVVDTFEPHEPWTPPDRYLRLNGSKPAHSPEPAMPGYAHVEDWLDPSERDYVIERMHALYAAEVTMTDRWIGELLGRLHELELERETVILLVADHGIFLGERGWTGKISVALYPELINVPLVIVHPDLQGPAESRYLASTHDVGPTLLSLAGVPVPLTMTGNDLSPILHGHEPKPRDFQYGGYTNSHFLRDDRWAYMSDNRLEEPHLYDLSVDPSESRDLAAEKPEVVEELAARVTEEAGGTLPYYE